MFDEARQIVNAQRNFHALRRSLRVLPDSNTPLNAFCIVTDTVATIAKSSPPSDKPFSARAAEESLYDPFVYTLRFDVWWKEAIKTKVVHGKYASEIIKSLR